MNDKTILKKAIERAIKGGYKIAVDFTYEDVFIELVISKGLHYKIIFSHDFAKAFWGEKKTLKELKKDLIGYHLRWQYHLTQMVLELEPLLYLEKFLKWWQKKDVNLYF